MQETEHIVRYSGDAKSNERHSELVTPYDIKHFLKRYTTTIAICSLIGLLAALAYSYWAVPMYTARTQMIIDPSLPQVLRDKSTETTFSIDNAQIESQLEILRSEKLALAVIDQLKLQDVPEFSQPQKSIWPFARESAADADALQRVALHRFQSNLYVRRTGVSYAIEILYDSESPELAANVANATAEAYIQEQFSARAQAAHRSNNWLEERINELRTHMNDAALNAQEFRAKRDYRLAPLREPGQGAQESPSEAAKATAAHRQNTLEELDSTAQTYRRIYESYLGAYTESVQKQSYPVTNARVISVASPFIAKSHPKTKLLLTLGGLVGCFVGFGIAFFRHSIDRSVTSVRQVRDEIGIECLASIPLLGSGANSTLTARLRNSRVTRLVKSILVRRPAVGAGLSKLVLAVNTRAGLTLQGYLAMRAMKGDAALTNPEDDRLNAAVTLPFSSFSHGVKTLKTAIALAGRTKPIRCLAVTSSLPNEGKTTLCANLAALYAAAGTRVLLIDGDLRTGRLSQMLAPHASLGLIDAIEGSADPEQCIVKTGDFGLHVLTAGDGATAHSDELLGSQKTQVLLKQLLKSYELIIIELPPLVASVDGLTMSSIVDSTVVVAEWGKTPVPVLSEVVHLLRNARTKILGIVLNKVDTSTVRYGDAAGEYLAYRSPATSPLRRRA